MSSSRSFNVLMVGLLAVFGVLYLQASFAGPVAQGDIPTTIRASHLRGVKVDKVDWKAKTAAYWKERLPPKVYAVCREGGTERAFTGALNKQKAPGTFACSSCGLALFKAEHKFDSGTGWPSFYEEYEPGAVSRLNDLSYGMLRTEVRCSRCDAHLGHVFDDGPRPTGLRYCINSVCLLHVPDK